MMGDTSIEITLDKETIDSNTIYSQSYKFYIPLHFWFCKNPGLALPLVALQNHDVELIVEIEKEENININSGFGKISNKDTVYVSHISTSIDCKPCIDYIFLDTEERKRFSQTSHEYLIEQLQINENISIEGKSENIFPLHFNHPVKELVWVSTVGVGTNGSHSTSSCDFVSLSNGTKDDAVVSLLFNGKERFTPRNMSYFTKVQPYIYHNNIPAQNTVGVYSFSLNPENIEPSGSCNFSRLDNVRFIMNFTNQKNDGVILDIKNVDDKEAILPVYSQKNITGNLQVFAVNYNVLRIMSGMSGLAYMC